MNVLITGASSGIGAALAVETAKSGGNLHLSGRDTARLHEVAERCRSVNPQVKVFEQTLDVTDAEGMAGWIAAADAATPLDRVFANAGVSTGEENEENSRRTFAINVGGTVNTVHPAIAAFRKRGRGQVVITASIAGYGPLKACPAYSATKACVKTWGLALRGMFKPEGIKVNVVCPGFVRSRITDGNTCPMPFFMEADRAARIILTRADRDVGLIAFPWPMRFAVWLLAGLPHFLGEAVNRLLPAKVL